MGRTRIPVDVTFGHYFAVNSILQHVLDDLEHSPVPGPKWVSCRLNQTGNPDPKPYFVAWRENRALEAIRKNENQPDPGLLRFLDDVDAPTYRLCLQNPTGALLQDWRSAKPQPASGPFKTFMHTPLFLYLEKGYYQLPNGHETHRLSIAIKVGDHYVGTLNTGLSDDPGTNLHKKMEDWAQDPASELVQYLKNEFDLGGPPVRRP